MNDSDEQISRRSPDSILSDFMTELPHTPKLVIGSMFHTDQTGSAVVYRTAGAATLDPSAPAAPQGLVLVTDEFISPSHGSGCESQRLQALSDFPTGSAAV